MLAVILAAAASVPAQAPPAVSSAPACHSSIVGTVRTITLQSKVFPGERTLRIWLPPGYDTTGQRRYPVLYVFDGQNAFDTCTGYQGHEWTLDEVATRLITSKAIPPIVIVAIDNGGARRANEYLPYADPFNPTAGQMEGDRLAAFLSQDVMPAVATSFRVSGDPAEIGVGGFSYGGIATLHLALTNPQLFGKALIESPSLQVGNGQLLRDATDAATLPNRIYIGMGGEETAIPPNAPPAIRERIARINAGLVVGARRLRDRLATALEAPPVKLVIDPAAHHGEDAWAKRLPAALTFLFGLGDAEKQAASK
jgi:predicted alpha/beta superfamily hydrolase